MAKTDIYQDVTDSIIEALEAGVSPWTCPWRCDGGRCLLTSIQVRGTRVSM